MLLEATLFFMADFFLWCVLSRLVLATGRLGQTLSTSIRS